MAVKRFDFLALRLSSTFALVAFLFLFFAGGCANEQQTLFEHDHVLPANWPDGLVQLSAFMEERLLLLRSGENAKASDELADLVKWIPQVAGDTDLPEAVWNRLNEKSLQIQAYFPLGKIAEESPLKSEFDELLKEIGEAQKILEDQQRSRDALLNGNTVSGVKQ